MMKWKLGPRDFGKHLADNAAERLLGQDVVADQVFGHVLLLLRMGNPHAAHITARADAIQGQSGHRMPTRRRSDQQGRKMQASVARCLRTPPVALLGAEDFDSQC